MPIFPSTFIYFFSSSFGKGSWRRKAFSYVSVKLFLPVHFGMELESSMKILLMKIISHFFPSKPSRIFERFP